MFGDRPCVKCKTIIKAEEKVCPNCGNIIGRENINRKTPGSYKNYLKDKKTGKWIRLPGSRKRY